MLCEKNIDFETRQLLFDCFVFFVSFVFSGQELKVGFIRGRGNDAQVEGQAFKNAKIEFEVIDEGDCKIDTLLKYDVIAIGGVAYDKNEPLKENFKVVNEYVEKGGYLVAVDFQQDSTWNKNFLPHPLELLDPDLGDNVGVFCLTTIFF